MNILKINFNHKSENLPEALGLNEEHAKDAASRVKTLVGEKGGKTSEIVEALIKDYEDEPAKLTYALLIVEVTEAEQAFAKMMASVEFAEEEA